MTRKYWGSLVDLMEIPEAFKLIGISNKNNPEARPDIGSYLRIKKKMLYHARNARSNLS